MMKKFLNPKSIILMFIATVVIIGLSVLIFVDLRLYYFNNNVISVKVRIDGNQCNMAGKKIYYMADNDRIIKSKNFNDYKESEKDVTKNTVKFNKGVYGINSFEFTVPNKYLDVFDGDIKINFGQFNTNSWHKNYYNIDVEIKQISQNQAYVKITQNLSYITDGEKKVSSNDSVTKTVNPQDNCISLLVGP